MKKILSLLWVVFTVTLSNAQGTFPVNGSHDVRPKKYAVTNATIITSPSKTISNATMLVDGQKITYVGTNKNIPKGYVIYDMNGKYVYPSFIDAFSTYGVTQPEI